MVVQRKKRSKKDEQMRPQNQIGVKRVKTRCLFEKNPLKINLYNIKINPWIIVLNLFKPNGLFRSVFACSFYLWGSFE